VIGKQSGRGHGLVAFVDTNQKLWRPHPALDRAELNAFDLARDRAELARRIDFCLDAAAGFLFDQRAEALKPFVLSVVHRRERQLHHESLVLSAHRGCGYHQCGDQCGEQSEVGDSHRILFIPSKKRASAAAAPTILAPAGAFPALALILGTSENIRNRSPNRGLKKPLSRRLSPRENRGGAHFRSSFFGIN
jgi:hypothetical protein